MELNQIVVEAILERKGDFVCDYDCRQLTPFMDHMIVATSTNIRQNNAIAQNIKDKIKENELNVPVRIEGDSNSKWLLVDLGEVVVHLFVKEERDVYQLDRLYADCPVQQYNV
jgi:ribosome-associated protein